MTTPAATAPAVIPAAVPAAPAPASAPAPAAAAPVAPPAAPAVPEVPAAPPAVAAPPAAPTSITEEDSLLPPGDVVPPPPAVPLTQAEQIAAAKKLIADSEAAADPNGGKTWLLNDTIMGEGEKPAWFKSSKYKTVTAQAEAYANLEPRFGAFVGAPKEGKYEFTPPEGVTVQMDHPLMVGFTKWAGEKQLSQEGYTEMLGMLVQYEAAQAPNMQAIKASMGADADSRLTAVAQWGKANLGEDYKILRSALAGKNAASVLSVIEKIIPQTQQARMPKPGQDVPGGQPGGLEAAKAAQAALGPDGKTRLYNTSEAHRRMVDKMYVDYYEGQRQ